MSKTICICGGGSLGLVCAGVFASAAHTVNILSGHPENWEKAIKVFDPEGKIYSGNLNIVSSEAAEVIPSADMVFLTLPGYLIEKTLRDIKPFLKPDGVVGSVVSSTGFFFFAHEILDSNQALFGFQRVPYIARYREYGAIGDLLGYKPLLNVAIENYPDPEALSNELEAMFNTPVSLLNNFYEASLTNSNPILHTGRLYSMWKNYAGETFGAPSLFYADWTDEASEYLIRMDGEFQQLLRKLAIPDGVIPTLLDYYESADAASLTAKLRSIQAFKSIKSPMNEVDGRWVPDFESRYFTEDFPFGLRFIKELAEKNDVSTPCIDEVYAWGMSKLTK